MPHWNSDIGGFFAGHYNKSWNDDSASKNPLYQELYVRWLQFGTFNPMMRSHGTDVYREIYKFGKKGEPVYDAIEKMIGLRYSLLPYIYSTSWEVSNRQSSFMRALMMDFVDDRKVWDYDVENDKVVPGTDRIIVNGGVNIEEKPIWIEAPHIYKKDGRYYLMCAEGGTGGWHSEVIFVSDHPKGPYLPSNNNPILTQRYFPANRADKVDWAGHADLVEGPDGKYYGVFLGIRPNEKNRVNTGRETFILPVDWSGTFPVFENGLIPMKPTLKMPSGVENQTGKNGYLPSGNFVFKDDFSDKTLDFRWIGLRGPREEFVEMTDKGLRIIPFTSNINEVKPTSTLFYRQQHNQFTAAATMEYKPKNEKDFAGITCYQNERYHYVFGITKKGKDYYLILQRTEKGQASVLGEMKIETEKPVTLQVTANGDDYRYFTLATHLHIKKQHNKYDKPHGLPARQNQF
jgi:beta-xylosidase